MTLIKFPHQQFLEINKDIIAAHPLPEPLRKRILGFEELEEDLQHTTNGDRSHLLNKLETLSHELDEDLEDYFGEWLENNHIEDEMKEQPSAENQQVEPIGPDPAAIEPTPEPETEKEPAVRSDEPDIAETAEAEKNLPHENTRVPEQNQELMEQQGDEVPTSLEPEPDLSDEDVLHGFVSEKQHSVHPSQLRERGFKGSLQHRTLIVGKFCLRKGKYDTCYRIHVTGE